MQPADGISRALALVVRLRRPLLVLYAILVPLAAWRATTIPNEGGIDRLVVPSDPDYAATRAFQQIFPESQTVLLLFESGDPWSPASIARVEGARSALASVPRVSAFSVLDALRRIRPGADAAELKPLALGTSFFRKQGLIGDRFLALVVNLDVRGSDERNAALAAVDAWSHASTPPGWTRCGRSGRLTSPRASSGSPRRPPPARSRSSPCCCSPRCCSSTDHGAPSSPSC